MKKLIFALIFAGFQAHAADYNCHAPANPNRGFEQSFTLQLSPDKVGGDVSITTVGKSKVGTISKIAVLSANDEMTQNAFELTLSLLADKDVSGLNNPVDVASIQAYEVALSTPGDHELKVFKMFDKDGRQIGGSIFADMHGDLCLP